MNTIQGTIFLYFRCGCWFTSPMSCSFTMFSFCGLAFSCCPLCWSCSHCLVGELQSKQWFALSASLDLFPNEYLRQRQWILLSTLFPVTSLVFLRASLRKVLSALLAGFTCTSVMRLGLPSSSQVSVMLVAKPFTSKTTVFDKTHTGFSGGTYVYYYFECQNSKYTTKEDIKYCIVKR